MAKTSHGGKREGAGRKKGAEQKKITFWVDKEALEKAKEKHGKGLNELYKLVNEWIAQLSKSNE